MSDDSRYEIKLGFVSGLREVVVSELKKHNLEIIRDREDTIYLAYNHELIPKILSLRSVARVYLVSRNDHYHPPYLSNHKSIFGELIEMVISPSFKTFKLSCAGPLSSEVKSIINYVEETYKLTQAEEADLKLYIAHTDATWEIGVQITPRPLSLREYKLRNMSGAMDPTVAYAMNSLVVGEGAESYLNIGSGSGTLLIEAALAYPELKKLIGFDNNKKHLSLAIQNIKEAGLITRVELKEADILENPDFGTFDIIVADLPFGMTISKGEDLERLYQTFVQYCETRLNPEGRVGVYTSETRLFERLIKESKLKVTTTLEIESITAVDAYLNTKIYILSF